MNASLSLEEVSQVAEFLFSVSLGVSFVETRAD